MRKTDFELTGLDNLFSTQEQRDDVKLSKIRDIPLGEIDGFPEHPFYVRDDEDMQLLSESIKERGIITPAMVRQKENGRYEMISGHRRKRASELAGLETLRCEVVDMSREEAIVIMVESNLQRSKVLPSEKAFAYKMRLEAMKRMPGRPSKENSGPVGPNLIGSRSNEELAEETGESSTQIKRYIRLTYLIPELLNYVDEEKIKMRSAVEISYLDEDSQKQLLDAINNFECFPSHNQTRIIRKMFDEGTLTTDAIDEIMSQEKPNQKEKLVFKADRIRQYLPRGISAENVEDYVCKALSHYGKFLMRQKNERDER